MYADINMMKRVFSAEIPANAKLVLFALIYHANRKTGEAFPSWELLASETGLSRSSISRSLGRMVKAGLVTKRRRPGWQSAVYRVMVPQRTSCDVAEIQGECRTDTSEVSQGHSNKSMEQKQPTEALTMFEEFWAAYPGNCPHKVDKDQCRRRYAELLSEASDRALFHQTVIEGLGRWRRSEMWQKENGRFIRAPLNWLERRSWEDEPMPKADEDGGRKPAPAVPANVDGTLCVERCGRCTGSGCGKGLKVPPAQSNPPYPPEECRYFSKVAA